MSNSALLKFMAAASAAPNVSGSIVLTGATLDVLQIYNFDGGVWTDYGNPSASLGVVGNPGLAAVTGTRAFVLNSAGGAQLTAWDFADPDWGVVGTPLTTIATPGFTGMTSLTSANAALLSINQAELRHYSFNGSIFSLTGSGLSIASTGNPALCALSSTRVVLVGSTADSLRAYDFNGSIWAQAGNTLSIAPVGTAPALVALTSSVFAFVDNTNDELRAYNFDGTDFTLIATFALSGFASGFLAALSYNVVALCSILDSAAVELSAYWLSGSSFTLLGTPFGILETSPRAIASMTYGVAAP